MKTAINKRLLVCSELVRDGAVLADVGTDHAYLPIYLLECGKIERAVLSDINQGPLNKARENSEKAGFIHNVELCLCNGASELKKYGATDYAICGMGGELIADIIEHAPHLKDKNVNLILQPMSKQEILREYLFSNGFDILKERYVTDAGKHYVCILARYSDSDTPFSDSDAAFGKIAAFEDALSPELFSYASAKLESLERAINGKRLGGISAEEESALLLELKKRMKLFNTEGH